jgi:hypothetical protein
VRKSLDLKDAVPFRPSMTAIIEKARKELPDRLDLSLVSPLVLVDRVKTFA